MEAARLKRARWRLRAYFIGSGIIMAFLFLLLAEGVIRFFGVEATNYLATLVFAAMVMAGGTYAIIYFSAVVVHVARRRLNKQPIMETED
ncbi:hypothetical protein [Sphingomonas sp. TF3]|jgi:hypothetical protein|nr:hypothetical protein [Sphingomonas sp. TF3]